ncbi:hypothetical protein DSO57_1037888 [Entomophthora muscae]|uniref:Uncharacterized protein n=1 Tax=Entomophthora muscae TaxID=34485 RepID=A0ACC2TAP8_9FUNG|nr:hypothetical protein DSO57_1037888 [Entomophthora muscae]
MLPISLSSSCAGLAPVWGWSVPHLHSSLCRPSVGPCVLVPGRACRVLFLLASAVSLLGLGLFLLFRGCVWGGSPPYVQPHCVWGVLPQAMRLFSCLAFLSAWVVPGSRGGVVGPLLVASWSGCVGSVPFFFLLVRALGPPGFPSCAGVGLLVAVWVPFCSGAPLPANMHLLFLPAYLPFLNPIEEVFGWLMQVVKQGTPTGTKDLFDLLQAGIHTLPAETVAKFYGHTDLFIPACLAKQPIN